MKIFPLLAGLVAALLLEGCYTPLIEGVQEGYDYVRRDALEAGIAADDMVSQYRLGDSYCCHGGGPMDKVSIYDNWKATYWYCRAARQGYGPAQARLARVYSGHAVHGLHVALRVSALAGDARTDMGVALMWANVAADHGADDGIELRDEIMRKASAGERARGAALLHDWRTAPCAWAEVFPAAGKE